MSWFDFTIHLPIPVTNASDSPTRTKRYPEQTTMRGEMMMKRRGNDDEEEGESEIGKGKGDNEGGGETMTRSKVEMEE